MRQTCTVISGYSFRMILRVCRSCCCGRKGCCCCSRTGPVEQKDNNFHAFVLIRMKVWTIFWECLASTKLTGHATLSKTSLTQVLNASKASANFFKAVDKVVNSQRRSPELHLPLIIWQERFVPNIDQLSRRGDPVWAEGVLAYQYEMSQTSSTAKSILREHCWFFFSLVMLPCHHKEQIWLCSVILSFFLSVHPSICGHPPPPENMMLGNTRNFERSFSVFFFLLFFFHPKFFLHPTPICSTSTFAFILFFWFIYFCLTIFLASEFWAQMILANFTPTNATKFLPDIHFFSLWVREDATKCHQAFFL